ncbi:MAG: hypothetical protein QW292_14530 [Candidatus Parvarchaeota archaeon]
MARRSYRRPRRYYVRRYAKRRHSRPKIGLFTLLGTGMGLGLSAFGPKGSTWEYFKQDPASQSKYVVNGIIAGVTGYDAINHDWNAGNLLEFWAPQLGFWLADKILKKFGLHHVHVFRNVRLA